MERLTSSFTRLDKLNGAHQALPIIPATPSGCQRIKGDLHPLQVMVRGMQTAEHRLRGERPGALLEESPLFKVAASFQEKSCGICCSQMLQMLPQPAPLILQEGEIKRRGAQLRMCSCVKEGGRWDDIKKKFLYLVQSFTHSHRDLSSEHKISCSFLFITLF